MAQQDVFGPFRKGLREFHSTVVDAAGAAVPYREHPRSLLIVHSTWGDFLAKAKPGAYRYQGLTGGAGGPFLVGFNATTLPFTDGEAAGFVAALANRWRAAHHWPVDIGGPVADAADLGLEPSHLVLLVNVFYEDADLMNNGDDYRLIRLVYPQATLEGVLEGFRSVTPRT
jgi:hypothetical protein